MKIDLVNYLKEREIFGLRKGTSIENFYEIMKISEEEKLTYTDDETYYSFLLDWNEFFFEDDHLASINLDVSGTIYLGDKKNEISRETDLYAFISYMCPLDISWKFYGENCRMNQLCIKMDELMIFFMLKNKEMKIDKIKLFQAE